MRSVLALVAFALFLAAPASAITEQITVAFGTTNYSLELTDFGANHTLQKKGKGTVTVDGKTYAIEWCWDEHGNVFIFNGETWLMALKGCVNPIPGGLHEALLNVPPSPKVGQWMHHPD
ncbi:MAG: hypothetical protein CSA62_15340 [Planctomycetota bacterium]|nr:MAG: hypothetical protein CSA62_15340 [Planctomycetota bacterium]